MNKQAIKQKIFQELNMIEAFPSLVPHIVSIGPVPVRPNFRRLFSYPKLVKLFVEYLAPVVKKTKADLLIGGETAGIPLAMALSLKTDLPFLYVRKKTKSKQGISHGTIEGDYQKGQRAILVEDILANGKTKLQFIKNLKRGGIRVTDIIVMIKTNNVMVPELKRLIQRDKIKIHHVVTWSELTKKQIIVGKIPKELGPLVLDYVNKPEAWHNNAKKWKRYCQLLRQLDMKVPLFLKHYE